MFDSGTRQVLPIALDLDSMAHEQSITHLATLPRVLFQLAIVHASAHREVSHLLQTHEIVALPSKPLIDVDVVLDKLVDGDLTKFGLKTRVVVLFTHGALQAVHFDTLSGLLFEMPVTAIEKVNELVSLVPPLPDIADGFFIALDFLKVKLEVFKRVTGSLIVRSPRCSCLRVFTREEPWLFCML